MNILIAYHINHQQIYLSELAKSYRECGAVVVVGWQNLFESSCPFDAIHFHWPEHLINQPYIGKDQHERLQRLTDRIMWWKCKGAKIVWTIHNEEPHGDRYKEIASTLYQSMMELSDILVHHCYASIEIMKKRFKTSGSEKNIVAPHGNYFSYPNEIDRQKAREHLGITTQSKVIISFGSLYSYKRIDLIYRAFIGLREGDSKLLIAGKSFDRRSTILVGLMGFLTPSVTVYQKDIPNDEIQIYFNASDVLVIAGSRLNSGVLILGMTFGLPVVAPSCGCLYEIGSQGYNVFYEQGKAVGLRDAIYQALHLDQDRVREENMAQAKQWTWERMAYKILKAAGLL